MYFILWGLTLVDLLAKLFPILSVICEKDFAGKVWWKKESQSLNGWGLKNGVFDWSCMQQTDVTIDQANANFEFSNYRLLKLQQLRIFSLHSNRVLVNQMIQSLMSFFVILCMHMN